MISIIIASVKNSQLLDVTANITKTIGVAYEIISFDNRNGAKGLCEIYNTGVERANYDVVCFMHEDVEIKTKNWGKIVLNSLDADHKLGLIGLAGSSYKSIAPSGWFCNGGPQKINYINLLQRYKFDKAETFHSYENPKNESLSYVVAVDGVWFCTKKSIAVKYPFDEKTFQKFHCYDIDYSLSLYPEYRTAVTFEVLLEHFSEGNYDRTWIEETIKLYEKWKHVMPIDMEGLTEKEVKISEKHAFRFFLKQMRKAGFDKKQRLSILINSKLYRTVGFGLFLKLCLNA